MFVKQLGPKSATTRIIWLHGWGQNHQSLLPLANLFADEAENYLLDLPGFGETPAPNSAWGTIEYANWLIAWLQQLAKKPTVIVGHSFGGRVAIAAAESYAQEIHAIVLLAAAGLKRKRSMAFTIKAYLLKKLARLCQGIDTIFHSQLKARFSKNFGSRDYKASSGIMRHVFVKTIQEDLATLAANITRPALLIYGSRDTETPSQFGQTYQQLIKNSAYFALPDLDHCSILSFGRHQVYNLMKQFLTKEQLC